MLFFLFLVYKELIGKLLFEWEEDSRIDPTADKLVLEIRKHSFYNRNETFEYSEIRLLIAA